MPDLAADIAHHAALDARMVQAAGEIRLLSMASWPAGREIDFCADYARGVARLPRIEYPRHDFSDIEALADACRFRDCSHAKEPGCAVRAAIEAGTLDPDRYANYLKLRDEVAGAANKLATRRAQKAEEKVLGKALNKRLDDKYGKH